MAAVKRETYSPEGGSTRVDLADGDDLGDILGPAQEPPLLQQPPAQEKPAFEPVTAGDESTPGRGRLGRFGSWVKQRPFTAGLLMILAGAVILTPAYLSFEVSNIQIQIATMSGVSTLLIGVLLISCGLMTWFQRDARILTGITALILAIVAIPTSNFGGFILGTLLALLGGAFALSWVPRDKPSKADRKRGRNNED
ncbi:hypothetical protein CAPI_06175 [Corynebacterium capitovis DSM 44611]|uniref:DUF6114 domain-containing protein n=1 Tax=Corynebacterium capitovis TaxID=131081 RepID=UPI000379B3C6|nr:DUF6114 domain-containing protein [Corynebacterium capitovis]WKD57779.1 hypothetical protein CAPI_06175 [Corynebacterium capitovis DSM 44611]